MSKPTENLKPEQKRLKKIASPFWRTRIKNAIELSQSLKGRKLTKEEKLATEYLSDTIEIADLRQSREQEQPIEDKIWTGKAQTM